MNQQRTPSSTIPIDLAGTAVTRSISDSADSIFKVYNEYVLIGVPEAKIVDRIKRNGDLMSSPSHFHAKFNKRSLLISERARQARDLLEFKGKGLNMTTRQREILHHYTIICDSNLPDDDIEESIDQEIKFLDYYKSMLSFHKDFKNSVPTTFALLTNTLGEIISEQSSKNTDLSAMAGLTDLPHLIVNPHAAPVPTSAPVAPPVSTSGDAVSTRGFIGSFIGL